MSKRSDNGPEIRSEIVLYQTEDGQSRIQVRLEDETVWLTQAAMAELFQTSVPNINIHIRNILREEELRAESVIKEFLITAADGKKYRTKHYTLDMILAVGYRVRSLRGTQFRQWATERLREYLVKGFTLDDDRLKGRDRLGDYFDELLARIREIRASEKRAYQRIREIFALASDCREGEQETQAFFAAMQNKMHFAAAGMTAAEIIRRRADADRANMGLTSWSGGRVLKRDVATAKNYLTEGEIDTLNRIVVMFLDQAEFRAQRRQDLRMRDWSGFLDKFLRDTELPVLEGLGEVSHDEALVWAETQYDAFAERRRLEAEQTAESRYLDDLQSSAEALEKKRKGSSSTRASSKPRSKNPSKK
ncbi:MAG: virulence RhuM family protein [Deltaproteobacteria bacterium]|nr:virulence RhuM family protein [Deltaproteobacteria bacterium]